MKTRALLSFFLLFSMLVSFGQPDSSVFTEKSKRKDIPDYIKNRKAYKRAEWFNVQRAFPYDTIPRTRYAQEMERVIKKVQTNRKNGDTGLTWSSVGPQGIQSPYTNWGKVSGRVRAIAVHPADPLTIYIGAASGGIWKTTNGGVSWADIGHSLESLSFGAIAIDPNNPETIYAGSGESSYLQGFIGFDGKGIFKSTDGGASWNLITNGIGSITNFGDLAVSPYNSNLVIGAMASGYFYSGNLPNEGIWRSMDAGETWSRTLDVQDAYDIVFHPTDANKVYAAVGGGNNNAGFYISNNQGISWLKSNFGLPPGNEIHRIQIDVSQSNPSIIYAVIFNLNTMFTKAYKSVNDGTSWAQISAGTNLGGYDGSGWYDQGFYDLCIAVDPVNPNHVLIGNIELHRTTNGSNFSPVRPFGSDLWGSLVHNDYHKLVFAPSNPDYLYIGCDGGFYQSTDKGYTATSRNQGLETLQFYRIASHPSNSQILFGGMQDNSNAISWNGGTTWTMKPSGDGMECFFNHDPDTVYSSAQCGYLFRSTNGGASFSYLNNVNGAWITPLLMHPVNHKTLYSANKSILKSTNAGASFFVIAANVSPEFINTMAQSQVNPNNMIFAAGCTQAPVPSNVIVVKVSTNAGVNWTDVTDHIPGEVRWVSRVVTDPVDDSTMYVLRTGFSPGNKVWKSTDLGQTWTNISGDLPDLPCSDLFIDPENTHHLYVANDIGVYSSTDGGTTWAYASEGIPFVPGIDFDYVNIGSTRYLRVGTFGRSMYETTLPHYCLPEGITFTTQEQIDNFQTNYPGCTEIEGNVSIEGSDITNLNGLIVLTAIGGDLSITWSNLTSLTGMNNLVSIGGNIMIGGNQSLTSLIGLEGLTAVPGSIQLWTLMDKNIVGNGFVNLTGLNNISSIEGDFDISANSGLINLTGMENLNSIEGDLIIRKTHLLTNLVGLNGLTTVHNLILGVGSTHGGYGNQNLLNLNGLDNLTTINGDFFLGLNWQLTSLQGIQNLDSIGGNLTIIMNDSLHTLAGLDNLSFIGGALEIDENAAINSLDGLVNLHSIGGVLQIGRWEQGNPSLINLAGLGNIDPGSISDLRIISNRSLSDCAVHSICDYLSSPGGTIEIHDNAPGCNNQEEVLAACETHCLPEGITFSTQAEIDSFQVNHPGCTQIEGNVIIHGSNITNLSGLSVLTTIGGELNIWGNSVLTNLTGLESLTSINGSISVNWNESLTSLTGLDSVLSTGGNLLILGNSLLTSLSGIGNITTVGGTLEIGQDPYGGNPNLTSLAGLEKLTSIGGSLSIVGNSLTSLAGLEGLTSIGGNLEINYNRLLTSLAGLEGLTALVNDLTIRYNTSLNNLSGLINVVSIGGNVEILSDSSLTSFSGLGNLSSIGGMLGLYWNESLTSLTGLEGLKSMGGVIIYGNDSLTSLSGLEGLNFIGGGLSLSQTSLTSLAGLNNVISISADLYVSNNNLLTSFTGLNNVTSIGGRIVVYENTALTSFTGLEGLTSIGSYLYIGGHPALTSLSALGNLTSIDGGINIYGNGMLTSLTGLDNIDAGSVTDLFITGNGSLSTCEVQSICNYLASPNGDVNIYNNAPGCNNPPEVASGCGIPSPCLPYGHFYFFSQSDVDNFQASYPGCTELHGNVTIRGNDITNLNGLNTVTSIGGNLSIGNWTEGNPLLTSLAGLDNLTSIGGELMIGHNYALSSLAGLDNIAAGSITNLIIVYNTSLTSCAVQSICEYLVDLHGSYALQGNAIGCRNITEVEDDCELLPVEEINYQKEIALFPNPAKKQVTIKAPKEVIFDDVVFYTQTGQKVLHGKPVNNNVDISKLPPGMYVVELGSGAWKVRKKLMVE